MFKFEVADKFCELTVFKFLQHQSHHKNLCATNLKYEISEFHDIDTLVASQRQRIVYFLRTQPALVLTLYLIDAHRNINHRLRSFLNHIMAISIWQMIVLDILFTHQHRYVMKK